jgi:hypothetical protein
VSAIRDKTATHSNAMLLRIAYMVLWNCWHNTLLIYISTTNIVLWRSAKWIFFPAHHSDTTHCTCTTRHFIAFSHSLLLSLCSILILIFFSCTGFFFIVKGKISSLSLKKKNHKSDKNAEQVNGRNKFHSFISSLPFLL